MDLRAIVALLDKLDHIEDDMRQRIVDIVLQGLEVNQKKVQAVDHKIDIFQETNKEEIGVLRLISNEREIKVGRISALSEELKERVDKLEKNKQN